MRVVKTQACHELGGSDTAMVGAAEMAAHLQRPPTFVSRASQKLFSDRITPSCKIQLCLSIASFHLENKTKENISFAAGHIWVLKGGVAFQLK